MTIGTPAAYQLAHLTMEMALTRYLVAYAGSALILVALDLLWLGLAMRGFYKAALAPIMREQPLIGPAILFYAVYAVGLVWFAVLPGIETGPPERTETRRGLAGSPKPLPVDFSSRCSAASTSGRSDAAVAPSRR